MKSTPTLAARIETETRFANCSSLHKHGCTGHRRASLCLTSMPRLSVSFSTTLRTRGLFQREHEIYGLRQSVPFFISSLLRNLRIALKSNASLRYRVNDIRRNLYNF